MSMAQDNVNLVPEIRKHSRWGMISFGLGDFIAEYSNTMFGLYVFFFYEAELGLSTWVASAGYIIYAIYNAINDPLFGYLLDRPFKFTRRWGKRYPWIVGVMTPWVLSFVLIFAVPNFGPKNRDLFMFIWLVLSTCLFDTFGTIFGNNRQALFPEKFRDPRERRTASTTVVSVSYFGTAAGTSIAPLLIIYGNKGSYLPGALIFAGLGILCNFLIAPGHREDPIMIEKALNEPPRENFLKTLVLAFKQKNFLIFVVLYVMYLFLVVSITASFQYVGKYILKVDPFTITLIGAPQFLVTLGMFPVWNKINQKQNNNGKMIVIYAIGLAIANSTYFVMGNVVGYVISGILYGVFLAGIWPLFRPIIGDVIDEVCVNVKRRIDGTMMGIFTFCSRAAIILQALSFSIVHTFTGFQEGAASQEFLANIGIRLHMSVIPSVILLLAALFFLRFYKLKPARLLEIKQELAKLNL